MQRWRMAGAHPPALRHARCPRPPRPLPAGDIFAYCSRHLPKFHPISISGYHMQVGWG